MGDIDTADRTPLLAEPEETYAHSPLYRATDWWTCAMATTLVFTGYLLTLAPDITLEDAGELVTAAMWTGVPNPPGYPLWTILTGLFIRLVPVSNIAFRVALASAIEASLACGLVALMVSRGSSLMIDGMAGWRSIKERQKNAICAVAGYDAAMLLGFNRTMWTEAVVPEIYPLAALSLVATLAVIFRWMYVPDQRRYIYWAAFLYGVCIVNHFTLILAAMGLELAIIVADPKLGRDLLAANVAWWLASLCFRWWRVILMIDYVNPMVLVISNIVGVLSLAGLAALILKTRGFLTEWKSVLAMVGGWLAGMSFFLYVPLASMTNPPMNWGYPRTVEGFFHCISRGQYDKINPEDFLNAPGHLLNQILWYFSSTAADFGFLYLLVAFVPFAVLLKMRKRERNWMIGLSGVFVCMALLLTVMLNPTRELQTAELVKRFYIPSFVPIAIWTGCGFALVAGWVAFKFRHLHAR